MSTAETARKLNVSKSTVRRWAKDWIKGNGRFRIQVKVLINPINHYRNFRKEDVCNLKKYLYPEQEMTTNKILLTTEMTKGVQNSDT